ncbi:MAG: GyrI-like domain-containing protein [Actinomycetota bacterium]
MDVLTRIERPTDRQDEFKASKDRIRLLEIPSHRFVMIDGVGPPVPEAFEARMPGLYGTAYGLRFALKARGVEGRVGPLEGLWWTTDGVRDLDAIFEGDDERGTWRWTLMIGLPPEATAGEIETHLGKARAKLAPEFAADLRDEVFTEGPVAQLMHVGPYSEERPTIERLHEGIRAAGYRPVGRHHELYLGDPRRSAPERLRTILRQPVA